MSDRLNHTALKLSPRFVGFDGASTRFRAHFPQGFRSPLYAQREYNYKIKAKTELDRLAPVEKAATGSGLGGAIIKAFRATDLLHHKFEKPKVEDLLRSADGDRFIRAAARLALGEMKPALEEIARVLAGHGLKKWTVVTYLPFLWAPATHMFLKPTMTRTFAANVGHRFARDYRPALDPEVYESLLDLATLTADKLKDFEPRSNIDIQSFMWTVECYELDPERTPALT
ncbi:hypothetical protein [Geminicoccus roseus]|uniref:hypothetical protein n=1 Tax=Geminicoccus roseus TaxID=404900 RepID=UPI00041A4960|nr:hypothetical protein [Geminicoccus roseus]